MRAREGALLSGQLPSGARVVTIWIVDLSRYKVLTAVLSSTELITFEELSAAALVVVRTHPQLIASMAPPCVCGGNNNVGGAHSPRPHTPQVIECM